MYVFNYSNIGYRHILNKTVLQDYSASYSDNERTIITCADGHGGELYIRSDVGSKFASEAVMKVFKGLTKKDICIKNLEKATTSIRLSVLCEWNDLVEKDLAKNRIRKSETLKLSDRQRFELKRRPQCAYGTTLTGAMLLGNKLVVISLGDTEALGVKKGDIEQLFNTDNDPAGNITYSMCQEDAFNYIRVAIIDKKSLDGVLLCTDGLSGPYQSYHNFNECFIKPMIHKLLLSNNYSEVRNNIKRIAEKEGTGDDVSLSFILFDNLKDRHYRR